MIKVKTDREPKVTKFCPFVSDPDKRCYCFDMNSQKIIGVIYYCMENFTECKFYGEIKLDRENY